MKKYLLDTNICIYHIKGLFDLDKKIANAGIENCLSFGNKYTVNDLFADIRGTVKYSDDLLKPEIEEWGELC
ncbi:MAG: hypothetical protein MUF15_17115 [Acidobacteria bacterium]|jgi:tRNA(fMet)-specific endonuclease VapC|nr:hypothetical protein [Acidobacteriota bacterium]